jgi:hypothetical protein
VDKSKYLSHLQQNVGPEGSGFESQSRQCRVGSVSPATSKVWESDLRSGYSRGAKSEALPVGGVTVAIPAQGWLRWISRSTYRTLTKRLPGRCGAHFVVGARTKHKLP